ncbi:MAG TPA: site-2 protease family protein [Polyangia bacterium]
MKTSGEEASPPRSRGAFKTAAVVSAVGVLTATKGKALLVLLKGLKAGPLLVTMGSMFAMVAFEAQRSSWLFGLGFVLMLLVHELGHAIAIRQAGLAAGYPVFIPFIGALITLKEQPRSSLIEARIAMAGPIAGTLAALLMTTFFLVFEHRIWLALAYTGFFLNLFNLVPLPPLDGGRVARVFSRRIWILGVALMLGLFLLSPSPQLAFIGIIALVHAFSSPNREPGPDEGTVSTKDRREVAFTYFGACAFLALGLLLAGQLLDPQR